MTPSSRPAQFRVLASTTLYEAGFLSLSRATVRAPDAQEFERHVVHHPGAVVAVPVDADHNVVMVRQFRVAAGRELLEVPAGKRDVPGESPAATAAREVEEEIGFRVGTLHPLCEFYNSPGFCDEYTYLFLATDLEACGRAAESAEEAAMTIEAVPLAEVDALIAQRVLVDAKSIIGVLLAREFLRGANAG